MAERRPPSDGPPTVRAAAGVGSAAMTARSRAPPPASDAPLINRANPCARAVWLPRKTQAGSSRRKPRIEQTGKRIRWQPSPPSFGDRPPRGACRDTSAAPRLRLRAADARLSLCIAQQTTHEEIWPGRGPAQPARYDRPWHAHDQDSVVRRRASARARRREYPSLELGVEVQRQDDMVRRGGSGKRYASVRPSICWRLAVAERRLPVDVGLL